MCICICNGWPGGPDRSFTAVRPPVPRSIAERWQGNVQACTSLYICTADISRCTQVCAIKCSDRLQRAGSVQVQDNVQDGAADIHVHKFTLFY